MHIDPGVAFIVGAILGFVAGMILTLDAIRRNRR